MVMIRDILVFPVADMNNKIDSDIAVNVEQL
jgi:hypothetical protein